MAARFFLSKLAIFGLLLISLALTACEDDLTAEQILSRAQEAAESVVAYRATGEVTIDFVDRDPQGGTITAEWSSPDRYHNVTDSTHDSEDASDFETTSTEVIQLGDSAYIRLVTQGADTPDESDWREITPPSSSVAHGIPSFLNLTQFGLAESVTVNGEAAYRIEGVPADPEGLPPAEELEIDAHDVVFISASDFRLIRVERTATIKEIEQELDPDVRIDLMPCPLEYTATTTMDFEYLTEPLVIEPPEDYVALDEEDDSQPHTSTTVPPPVTATATPTVAPGSGGPGPLSLATVTPAPFPTFAPDDPRRNLPLWLEDTPSYDKLELGNDVVVSYPSCNPNSILDRFAHTIIYYTKDGSYAANWTIHDTFAEGENGAETDISGFYDFDHTVYRSEEGRAALDAVLSDPEVMSQIREYAAKPARCPDEFVAMYREEFDSPPDYDKLVIDEDTVALFESCDTDYDEHVAPIVIEHFPTGSAIAVTPGEPGFQRTGIGTPSGDEWLQQVVEDEALMEQIVAMSPREARCG